MDSTMTIPDRIDCLLLGIQPGPLQPAQIDLALALLREAAEKLRVLGEITLPAEEGK